jgi:hypothetical protein
MCKNVVANSVLEPPKMHLRSLFGMFAGTSADAVGNADCGTVPVLAGRGEAL